jgi:two-component system sensor histidine kinase PilS (NtrC family)
MTERASASAKNLADLTPEVDGEVGPGQAGRRLLMFMGTRLAVATLLLGGTLLLALDNSRGMDAFTPRFLMTLIAAMYTSSIVFSVWLIASHRRATVAMAQVVFDLSITTALVYISGGASSGFTFLYGVAVLMAAMVIGPTAARAAGVAAVLLFTAMILGLSLHVLPPPADQSLDAYRMPLTDLVYAALLNVLGLCLVTLLAAGLSARLLSAGGQLKRAEASAASLARLNEDIVRSLNSGLITTDLAGRIRTINPAAVEMLRAEAGVFMGEAIDRFLPIDVAGFVRRSAQRDAAVSRAEGRATRPDGSRFPVGYSLNGLTDNTGQLLGGLVMFQDLSEIVQLREAATRGERLAVLGRLSAGLAHEIRNPLSSISGSVELVRSGADLDEEDRRLLGIVLREVERLDDLVSTMLLVGKPREPLRHELDLRVIVDEVVEIARRGPAADAGVSIETELPEAPVTAWVDGDQFRQVLWNLVKNALQASPRGKVVRVCAHSTTADAAVIEVIDQGRGIDANQRERIYDMFHSERTHGAGIGLALVRQIIDAHQGSIDIVSEQHRGATFVVTFPAHPNARLARAVRSHPPAA